MNTKEYLRDLAKRQLEYAMTPENQKLEQEWYEHNALEGKRPMVVFEEDTCKGELFTLKCEDPDERALEAQLLQTLNAHEKIGDDKVVPNTLEIPVKVDAQWFGVEFRGQNAGLGYHIDPVLVDLDEDLCKLSPSTFTYDREGTERLERLAGDCFGDILPTRRTNRFNCWNHALTQKVVNLMSMEGMYYAMYDTPEKLHELMQFLVDDCRRLLRWEEENGLLYANAGNDYMGSGSYCFNRELQQSGQAVSTQTWGHLNSQESVGISKDMYAEFIHPYHVQIASEFGLLYYGCCEPVDPVWDDCVSKLPNLRKVSISPWCNEEFMAERLKNQKVIYSRKPSPNFLGINPEFDEDGFRAHIRKTVELTRDCHTEFIFRDVYTLHNRLEKARRAVEIVREEISR